MNIVITMTNEMEKLDYWWSSSSTFWRVIEGGPMLPLELTDGNYELMMLPG
jgi:hypothetical protein